MRLKVTKPSTVDGTSYPKFGGLYYMEPPSKKTSWGFSAIYFETTVNAENRMVLEGTNHMKQHEAERERERETGPKRFGMRTARLSLTTPGGNSRHAARAPRERHTSATPGLLVLLSVG